MIMAARYRKLENGSYSDSLDQAPTYESCGSDTDTLPSSRSYGCFSSTLKTLRWIVAFVLLVAIFGLELRALTVASKRHPGLLGEVNGLVPKCELTEGQVRSDEH